MRPIAKRQVQLLGDLVPSRMVLQARDRQFGRVPSERHLRARLEPDLTDLLKRVLSWTPSHDGPFPPGKSAQDFRRVEQSFGSPQKYQEVFEPLLMLECWQHIQQAKMEATEESFEFVVDNRQKIDEYVELFVSMELLEYNRVALQDPDLVIISGARGKGGKECFAKVQGMKRKKDSVELVLRCIPASEPASILVPKATLHGVKLFKYSICWPN
jgi:senataxin